MFFVLKVIGCLFVYSNFLVFIFMLMVLVNSVISGVSGNVVVKSWKDDVVEINIYINKKFKILVDIL